MRVDEQARECVSFLYVRQAQPDGTFQLRPVGTAFYIGVNLGRDRYLKYAVTARHVVEGSRPHGSLVVRCVGSQRRVLFELPQDNWWLHPSTDVAIATLEIVLEDFGLKYLSTDHLATREWIEEHNVGVGDRLAISGMFSHYLGGERDEPIVRFGRIALTPRELIRVPPKGGVAGMQIEAVLVEAAAWAGQSGSPVFVHFSIDRNLFAGNELSMTIPSPKLLGLLHGHYLINQPVLEKETEFVDAHVPLNSGIAIVVPAESILELLEQDEVREQREEIKELHRGEGLID